jgi:hypothetical protein
MQNNRWKKTLLAVGIFAVAMAFLESAVVVYLRSLYYPEGFSFPLKVMPPNILVVEVIREAATIVMLAAIAWIAGHTFLGRFAFFSFAFGVWDIFYYVFLKLAINWPVTLTDWDILFLIPLPWIAPVLAPLLVSMCLIAASVVILRRESVGKPVRFSLFHWAFLALGGIIIIVSFLLDQNVATLQSNPGSYNWYLFAAGIILGLFTYVAALRR